MNEIKLFRAILWTAFLFALYLVLQHYVFGRELNVWFIVVVPVDWDILKLSSRYYIIWEKRNQKGLVVLNKSLLDATDFIWIAFFIAFVIYTRLDVLLYFIPAAALNAYLLYLTNKHQCYYFDKKFIENLNTSEDTIDTSNVVSWKLKDHKLKVVYLKNVYKDKDDKDNRIKFSIKRSDLKSPNSWHEFEKIALIFQEELEKEKVKSDKNIILVQR